MSLCLYPPISNMVVYLITCFCFRVPLIRLWFEITAPSAEADHWWEKFFEGWLALASIPSTEVTPWRWQAPLWGHTPEQLLDPYSSTLLQEVWEQH